MWLDGHKRKNMQTTSSYKSLSHSRWDCKYHLVFVPKYRKKTMYGEIRKFLKNTFHELASQRNCEIVSGNLVRDHVHMLIRIPPKYAISEIVGYLKGKSAIAIARRFSKRKRNFNGESFWARGYSVSSVGYDQESIKAYIEKQEKYDKEEGCF